MNRIKEFMKMSVLLLLAVCLIIFNIVLIERYKVLNNQKHAAIAERNLIENRLKIENLKLETVRLDYEIKELQLDKLQDLISKKNNLDKNSIDEEE